MQAFTLANPYRVILDLPDLTFQLDPAVGQKGRGLVTAFRYGLFAEHKSRVVIDTTGPVKIASAAMTRVGSGKAVKLAVVLRPTDAASFGAGTGAALPSQSDSGAQRAPRGNDEPSARFAANPSSLSIPVTAESIPARSASTTCSRRRSYLLSPSNSKQR